MQNKYVVGMLVTIAILIALGVNNLNKSWATQVKATNDFGILQLKNCQDQKRNVVDCVRVSAQHPDAVKACIMDKEDPSL